VTHPARCWSFAWILLIVSTASAADPLAPGSGHFVFTGSPGTAKRPVTVWYEVPESLHAESPVLFVMHGVLRNGEEYRDAWAALAREHGFLLLVPEFSSEHYPGSTSYHQGGVYRRNGRGYEETDEALWAYSAIDPIFDEARERTGVTAETYTIYGHSAGAQFVHRLVLFKPDARYDRALAANAGSYALPTLDTAYPYGLGLDDAEGQARNAERLEKALRRRLVILLGEADTDENDPYLPTSAEAKAQGRHRFERGHTFLDTARREAAARGIELLWELHTVPGVGHDNARMAPAAVKVLGW
jgi:poly(3-hydroxybutyrate) depolymerase